MRIRTDDQVYRVDAVWLGPPKATFPARVRYVAWGVGVAVFLLVLTIERWLGVGFGFFSTAWALVATVIITKFIAARITHERPLGAVAQMALAELRTPREVTTPTVGAAGLAGLTVRERLPAPKASAAAKPSRATTHSGDAPAGDPQRRGTHSKEPQHGF